MSDYIKLPNATLKTRLLSHIRIHLGHSSANVGVIVGSVVGGVVGLLCLLGVLIGLSFFFSNAPLLSNSIYVQNGLGFSKGIGADLFRSGPVTGSFFKDGVWHTTRSSTFAFYPNAANAVYGKGADSLGKFVATGVYSPRTQRIGFNKRYQTGLRDAGRNPGTTMKVQAKWNPKTESFEGKYYLKQGKRRESGQHVLRFTNKIHRGR